MDNLTAGPIAEFTIGNWQLIADWGFESADSIVFIEPLSHGS